MNRWVILVKREFWEYRSLWIAPLAAAALLLIGALFAKTDIRIDNPRAQMEFAANAIKYSAYGVGAFLLLASSITTFSYLLDCLYAERKDRSILFWKSLPVSDSHTVLTKLAVAMLIVPLGVFALEMVTYLILTGIGTMRFAHPLVHGWTLGSWLAVQGDIFLCLLVTLLWYAPIAAYFMLMSVTARRAPFVMAALPPLGLALGEWIVFRTSHVGLFLTQRLGVVQDAAEGIARPGLWIGLVVAVAVLYLVIRMRRYRDDT
jgi:ABC-2 type transport system permease protein